ncbi:hypothetical protein FSP39_017763 [Pinctada imbricata]|uniref:Uncharacterized protein n=1 Tax=Pinctada imbricata TaxID=66713 RepID=A0AA89BMJ3_PINIB|nr:hypothetical protein FSP39_017763 [Pinctada imbricata]
MREQKVETGYNRPFNSAITKRRASVTFDIGIIKEEESELSSWKNEKDKGIIFRRMSAPELPPIQTSPSPMTIPRHRYLHSRSNNKSNTSENSQRSRPMKSPFSAGSSESNNSHGHRRVPNGLVGHRSKTWVPSDQTLTEITPNQKVLSIDKTDILTRNTRNAGTVNGMRRYASTVQLTPQKSTVDDDLLDYDSSSDSDKDQMIITWLIGVDTEDPEEPPEQEIFYPDEPPQTDTAVHIIYNGDS